MSQWEHFFVPRGKKRKSLIYCKIWLYLRDVGGARLVITIHHVESSQGLATSPLASPLARLS
jgi:hypothetical protein